MSSNLRIPGTWVYKFDPKIYEKNQDPTKEYLELPQIYFPTTLSLFKDFDPKYVIHAGSGSTFLSLSTHRLFNDIIMEIKVRYLIPNVSSMATLCQVGDLKVLHLGQISRGCNESSILFPQRGLELAKILSTEIDHRWWNTKEIIQGKFNNYLSNLINK